MKFKNLLKIIGAVCIGFFLLSSLSFAAAASKPTVVVVYSHGCPMCDEFEARVLADAEVKKALRKFNVKKVNASTTKIDVEVTPTVIIYDKNKKQVRKFVPSLEKRKFIDILNKVDG